MSKHDVKTEDEAENESANSMNGGTLMDEDKTGIGEPGSFELTNEEVLALVQSMGFSILSHSTLPSSSGGYIQDPDSMLQNRYSCSHWIAKKIS